jgi:hypothetical protein
MFPEFCPSWDPLPLLDPGRAFGVLIIVYLGQHAGSRGHKVFAEAK